MSLLVIPNVLVNGTGPANIIDAVALNANFTAIATAVNNIYPSQILPITTGQATFGATAVGVGFKFLANDATATPLTVSGVGGQSADILDVTLTSGGTKVFFLDKNGSINLGPNPAGALATSSNVAIYNDASATNGMIFDVPTGSTHGWQWFLGDTNIAMRLTNAPNLYVAPGSAGSVSIPSPFNALSGGDAVFQRGASTGQIICGGATQNGSWDFGLSVGNEWTARNAAGYVQVNGAAYNNLSDESVKSNIAALTSGSAEILALKPSSFTMNATQKTGLGFVAQDVQAVLPDLITMDNAGMLLVNYDGIIPVLVKAFQEMSASLKAAGVAGF